ncbi:MAG: hypothetical protein ACRBBR_00650 [Cellvibrionaceae bacterium]
MRIQESLAGNAKIKRSISGRHVLVKEATGEIMISSKGLDVVNLGAGEYYDLGQNFNNQELTIQNSISGSNSFVMEITQNLISKPNQNALNVNATATVENGDDNNHLARVTLAAGATAAIASANGSRKYLRVALLSDAVGYVLLGKSGVNAASGGPLEAGMIDYMETEGALFAHNPQAVPVDVWLMEINKL